MRLFIRILFIWSHVSCWTSDIKFSHDFTSSKKCRWMEINCGGAALKKFRSVSSVVVYFITYLIKANNDFLYITLNVIYIYIYIYMYMYIYIYIYIYIKFQAMNNVLHAKMVLKTHLFIKIFRLLYRSFVSLIRISRYIKRKFSKV